MEISSRLVIFLYFNFSYLMVFLGFMPKYLIIHPNKNHLILKQNRIISEDAACIFLTAQLL